jgi:O-antigen/teichoic acid export membrane protein
MDTALDLLTGTASSILVARALGPENLGHYTYALTLVNLTGLVAALGVPLATRKYMAEYLAQDDLPAALAILRTTFRFQVLLTLALVSLGVAWVALSGRAVFLYPAILSLIPALLRGVATGALVATEDARWTVRASMVSALVHLASVVVVIVAGWGLVGLTSALLLSRTLDFAIRWHFVRRLLFARHHGPAPALSKEVLGRVVRFCWHASLLLVLDILVWQRSEVLFLEHFSPIENVAFFSISFGAAQAVMLLPRVIEYASSMTLMAETGRNPARVASLSVEVTYLLALVSVPLGAILAGLAEPLVILVYGARFAPAATVLAVVAVLGPVRALFLSARSLLVARDQQRILLRWTLGGAVLNVALALTLIPPLGAIGAAWTKVLTQTLVTVLVWTAIGMTLGARLPAWRLARLGACGVLLALVLRAIVSLVPGVPGMGLAILAGLPLMGVSLRLMRTIDPTTRDRLSAMRRLLPDRLGGPYLALVRLVAGEGPGEQGP